MNAKASTAPGMSGVNAGKGSTSSSLTEISCKSCPGMFAYRSILHGAADSSASLVGGLVSMARGIGTTFGISLIALAQHLGCHSYQAGNLGYSGSEQARPAFAVLAVVAAPAAAIALASRTRAGTSGAAEGGRSVRCRPLRDT
jgi:hypothetical protein